MMEVEQSHMTEMICDHALEIIYLLTGEKHAAVKMTSIQGLLHGVYPPMPIGVRLSKKPITKPLVHSWISETNNQKILEVTKKIVELLVGEVSSAGNLGSAHSFMEERRNVAKDQLLYPIMENQPPITLVDGTRNRSPPQRCPHPLYPQDSTQKNQEVPHHVQVSVEMKIKKEVKEDPEKSYVRDAELCMEEEISTEPSISPAHEGYNTPQNDQQAHPLEMKRQEEPRVRGGEHYEEEESSPQITADWWHVRDPQEQPHHLHRETSSHTGEKPYSCSECGKSFVNKSTLSLHKKTHTGKNLYSCSECGKCFYQKSNLSEHKKTHTGEKPYACSQCGRCFSRKTVLVRHERVHSGEKPYSCSQCGRSFSQKSHLTDHAKIHTGNNLHWCSECGKCFASKSSLYTHKNISHREETIFLLDRGNIFPAFCP